MVYALNISDPTVNPIAKFSDFSKILNLVIPILIRGVGIVTLIMALIGAFNIITAGGDSEKFKKGQQVFKNAVVGIIIVIASFLIVKLIEFIFGIELPI